VTAAASLGRRLLVIQVSTQLATFGLSAAFAPRVLLLSPSAAQASMIVLGSIAVVAMAFSAAMAGLVMRPVRPLASAIALGGTEGDPAQVLALYDAPSRLTLANVAFVLLAMAVPTVPTFRPAALDGYTVLALALLVLTMGATAALPAYVFMRAQAARVLERVDPRVAEAALRMLGRSVVGRLRKRYVAAVAVPVALVALGASLLADAHARADATAARMRDAAEIVQAAFEPLASGGPDAIAGRTAAIEAAAELGYRIRLVTRDDAAETIDEPYLLVAIDGSGSGSGSDAMAAVAFVSPKISATFPIYALLMAVAVALAAIVGIRAAGFFERDIALATREIRRAGVAEVMRGTMILHQARFSNVGGLMDAIDALGAIFREFASAQERAIEAREATERMRGLLLASMSHDLKAPLNAVLGFTELVRRNPLTREQHESLAIIEQRGRELLVLIDTILDSARVEAGELEVSPSPTLVADVVMSSVLEARDLAVGTDVQIMGEIQPGIPAVMIDATRIVQALTAVVMTAARFSDRGVVPVRATLPDPGDHLRIEVETSGEGLPMAEREKIFDAFKSAESARRQGGLGLGLQLARSIVEIHGGAIEVDSTGGGGMAFRVWLPVANDSDRIRARASQPSLEIQ
jgi:signal transduction histidine kinase